MLGLPGNPVSAVVCFTCSPRPRCARCRARRRCRRGATIALEPPVPRRADREQAIRVALDGDGGVHANGPQGSHVLTSLVGADALAFVSPGEGDAGEAEVADSPLSARPTPAAAARLTDSPIHGSSPSSRRRRAGYGYAGLDVAAHPEDRRADPGAAILATVQVPAPALARVLRALMVLAGFLLALASRLSFIVATLIAALVAFLAGISPALRPMERRSARAQPRLLLPDPAGDARRRKPRHGAGHVGGRRGRRPRRARSTPGAIHRSRRGTPSRRAGARYQLARRGVQPLGSVSQEDLAAVDAVAWPTPSPTSATTSMRPSRPPVRWPVTRTAAIRPGARAVGTVAGALVLTLLVGLIDYQTVLIVIAVAACVVAFTVQQRSVALFSFFLTVFIAVLTGVEDGSELLEAVRRVAAAVVGGVFALALGYAVFPGPERVRLGDQVRRALDAVAGAAQDAGAHSPLRRPSMEVSNLAALAERASHETVADGIDPRQAADLAAALERANDALAIMALERAALDLDPLRPRWPNCGRAWTTRGCWA